MLPLPNFISSSNSKQTGETSSKPNPVKNIKTGVNVTRPDQISHHPRKPWNGWCSQPNSFSGGDSNTPYPIKPQEKMLSCDACCQTFFGEEKLRQHLTEHIKCGMEGCLFEAHYNIVFKHQNSEHFNLKDIAAKIVKLETPEDIEKWREARRKNFPTLSRISERQALKTQINEANHNRKNHNESRRFKRPHPYHQNTQPVPSIHTAQVKRAVEEKIIPSKENLLEKEDGEISEDEEVVAKLDEPQIKNPIGLCDYPSSDDDAGHERKPSVVDTLEVAVKAIKSPPQQQAAQDAKRNKMFKKDKFNKNQSKRANVSRRPLSLFEKLLLNDVRREESKIVACLEVLRKVDYKL